MKVSIITVIYNNADYIEDCIRSVLSQSYQDIEYIIIDGQSTDGTLEIINRYQSKISKIISEKDRGHVYAINKGLNLCTGEIAGILHSDDVYAHEKVIEKVVNAFKQTSVDGVYGDLVYVKKNSQNKIMRYWQGGDCSREKIKRGWMPPHPTFFVKKNIYDQYDLPNTDFRIAFDYELSLRFLYKYRIAVFYLPEVLVKMRLGGISNRGIGNIIQKTVEDYRACRRYGLGISTVVKKNIRKLPQFFCSIK